MVALVRKLVKVLAAFLKLILNRVKPGTPPLASLLVVYRPLVTVAALPVVVPEEPVIEPTMGLVTVKSVSVPSEVRDEARIFEAKVVPVSVLAAEVMVMGTEPSKLTPLIARGVVNLAAEPVVFWLKVGKEVKAAALPLGAKKTVPASVV